MASHTITTHDDVHPFVKVESDSGLFKRGRGHSQFSSVNLLDVDDLSTPRAASSHDEFHQVGRRAIHFGVAETFPLEPAKLRHVDGSACQSAITVPLRVKVATVITDIADMPARPLFMKTQ